MHHMRWWHTKAENIISHALSAYAAQMAMEKNKSLRKGTGDLLQPSSHTDAGYKVGKIWTLTEHQIQAFEVGGCSFSEDSIFWEGWLSRFPNPLIWHESTECA